MPTAMYCGGELAWECEWRDDMTPLSMVNRREGVIYKWIYNDTPDTFATHIHIQGLNKPRFSPSRGKWDKEGDTFSVLYDNVGSLRALVSATGRLVKRVDYDSFGNVLYDTLPKLFIPQGFAGGMIDPFMGLIKFGYRYYDPQVGRFTSKDPAKDMRGDGDLYDYCVDDPIGRVDRDGRFFMFLPLLGKIATLALGGAGVYAAARVTDEVEEMRTGEESSAARDGAWSVADETATTVLGTATPFVPGAIGAGANATVKGVTQVMDKVPLYTRNKNIIDKGLNMGSDALESYTIPGPPSAPFTVGGTIGFGLSNKDLIKDKFKKTVNWGKNLFR